MPRNTKKSGFTIAVSAFAALFVIAIGVVVVLASNANSQAAVANQPANMAYGAVSIAEEGVVLSEGVEGVEAVDELPASEDVLDVRVYLDYLCPFCQQFELQYGAGLEALAANGEARVSYFPVAILDPASANTRYSTRAANAASCVAQYDPNSFSAFHMAMFVGQPGEGASGLTDDEIIGVYNSVGGSSTDVEQCIVNEDFRGWTKLITDTALESVSPLGEPLRGVPAVIVDGELFSGNEEFTAFMERKRAERNS